MMPATSENPYAWKFRTRLGKVIAIRSSDGNTGEVHRHAALVA
jgi:hypothetical protein